MLAILTLSFALGYAKERLLRSLPRLKWLFISIFLVYGWTVPGQYLGSYWFSPTDAGLLLGLEQVLRLLIVTSSLQVLVARMTKPEIFTSIYLFLTPLHYFNQIQSRFAVRFALTLEKAEALLEAKNSFRSLLDLILQPQQQTQTEYVLQYVPLNLFQRTLFAGQCVLILLTVFLGVAGFWS